MTATTKTTIKLSGGSFGMDEMLVRCDLSQASAPVEADYCQGDGWVPTQYQCADTRHTTKGLISVGKELAARELEVAISEFECDAEEVE